MRASLLFLVLLLSCAAPPVKRAPPPLPVGFISSGLRDKHVQVEVVDRGRLFDGNPGVVSATKKAVEEQLSSHGVIIDEVPSAELRRIVLTVDVPVMGTTYSRSCVQVSGRLERTSQAFLPTQEMVETRCGGRGPGEGPANAVSAVFALVGEAIAAGDGSRDRKELAAALSGAVIEVLSQIEIRAR